ncbi:MAG: hypothetical protein JST28_09030 [Acidobacteria bacterium]|nr:hypothetical protein [Acidobacteriota bacterium]
MSRDLEHPRWRIWPVALGAVVLFFVIAHEVDRQGAVKAAAAKDAFISDWTAGRIATVEAFTSRCGQPRSIEQTKSGPVLHYTSGGIGDYLVRFPLNAELEHPRVHDSYTTKVQPEQLFTQLHCK